MPAIAWIKITTTIFDDEKIQMIESLPDADTILVIWMKLLTLAGKCNASGHLMFSETIPYTDQMLATMFRRDVTLVKSALSTFQKFGMIDLADTIYISNWEKHQNIETLDRVREQNRIRNKKYRDNKALKAIVSTNERDVFADVTCDAEMTSRDAPRSKNKEVRSKDYAGDKKTTPAPSPGSDEKKQHNERLTWFKNWFVWVCQEMNGAKYAFTKADGVMIDRMLKAVGLPDLLQRSSHYLVMDDETRWPRGAPTVKGLNMMLNQLAGKDGRAACQADGLLPTEFLNLRDFTPWKGVVKNGVDSIAA